MTVGAETAGVPRGGGLAAGVATGGCATLGDESAAGRWRCAVSRGTEVAGGSVPVTPGVAGGAAIRELGLAKSGTLGVGAVPAEPRVGALAASARGGLAYVEAAALELSAVAGARGVPRCSMRMGGAVLIAVADDASSPGTRTRFDRTGVRPRSEDAGTADKAPGTARLTWRADGRLSRSLASTP